MYDGREGWVLERFVGWWWKVSPMNVLGKVGRGFERYVL